MKLFTLFLALAFIPAALAVYPGDPGFLGCVISDNTGTFDDHDCDRFPDIFDNCPLAPNPEQVDVDQNGVGDACDLVIDEMRIEPEQPMQGRSVIVHLGVYNNRDYPMRNLIARIEVPALGLTASEPLPILEPGQRVVKDLITRIPDCAPPRYTDVVALVEYPYAPSQKEVFSRAAKVAVAPSGLCGGGEELTVVDIIELQDILPDQPAVYPFTITNNWPESKAYILTVHGHERWGVAEISTGSVVVIPPGGTRQGEIRVWAFDGMEGMQAFTLAVQARDDAKQVLLQADIKRIETPPRIQPGNQFLLGVLAFCAILILIAIVAAYMHHLHRETKAKKGKK